MSKSWTEGWHFLPADRRLANGDGRLVVAGETLRVDGPPVLCERGFHASASPLDALQYAPSPIVQRVCLGGEILYGEDKAVATERACLWLADATPALHEFAVLCAEGAMLGVSLAGGYVHPASINVVAVKRRWMRDEATDAELAYARDAAYAARDAARAARAAAYAAYAAWGARAAAYAAWGAQSTRLEAMLMELAPKQGG